DTQNLVVIACHVSGNSQSCGSKGRRPSSVVVDGLEVTGKLTGGDADRGDRGRVVHPPRTDHADGAEVAVAETVVGADDARRAQRRLRVLVADPEEDRALRE